MAISMSTTPKRPMSAMTTATTTTTATLDASEHPEWPAGVRPWVAMVGCFFLMFNSWGLVNAYGTFASYYMQHLMPGQDLLRLGTIGGTDCFVVLALSAVTGRLLDAGFYRYLTITGAVFVTVGMFSLAWAAGDGGFNQGKYPVIWLTQGLTMGLGMACFFVASSQIIATWFVRRKSTAIGIVASGASIAGLVYPVATKFLISALGWRNAVMSVSAIVCSTCLIAVFCAVPSPMASVRKPDSWVKLDTWVDTHAFSHRSFCWFVAAIAAMFFGFYPVFFNLEEWATVTGVGYRDEPAIGIDGEHLLPTPKPTAGPGAIRTFYLLGIMNGSSTVGRIGAALLSDRFPATYVHMVSTGLCSILILTVWTTASTIGHTLAFVVLFGAFSGAVIGLPPASMATILGTSHYGRAKLGHWTGMMYTCAAIPALIGPVVVGHLVTVYKTFLTVQIWSGICLLISTICMAIAAWCGEVNHEEAMIKDGTISGPPSGFNSKAPTICIGETDGDDVEKINDLTSPSGLVVTANPSLVRLDQPNGQRQTTLSFAA